MPGCPAVLCHFSKAHDLPARCWHTELSTFSLFMIYVSGTMTASGNSLNDSFFFLPFLSLVYFAQCNPIKGKANWSLASFLLSLAKKSITGSPELLRLLSVCISISIGFAGPGRIDGNMFNSILIFFIFSKMETTLWSYIMMKGEGGLMEIAFEGKLGMFLRILVCFWESACFSDVFVWYGSHSGNQVVIA